MATGKRWIWFPVALGILAAAGAANAEIYTAQVTLNGGQEVPPNGSTATGSGTVSINTATNTLKFSIAFSGLSAPETAAHIHGPAPKGQNAGVLFPLPLGSPKVGVWNYSEALEGDILAGRTYFNIHTGAFPGGEIRGQIQPTLAVPSLSQWGASLLALGLLVAGTLFVVRRRRAFA